MADKLTKQNKTKQKQKQNKTVFLLCYCHEIYRVETDNQNCCEYVEFKAILEKIDILSTTS